MAPLAQAPRRYRGLTAAERRAQRRELLLEAGLELFGTQGYTNTSVRAISAAASLNSRYFYESFADREALLRAVYEQIVQELARAAREATAGANTIEQIARAGIGTTWAILTGDRRKARVLAIEVVGVSDRMERLRRDYRHAFADILVANSFSVAPPGVKLRFDPVLNARAMTGAAMEVLVDWINGDVEAEIDEIVEQLTQLFTAAAIAGTVGAEGLPPDWRVKQAADGQL
jgi:AcrR family transcriptional regulator